MDFEFFQVGGHRRSFPGLSQPKQCMRNAAICRKPLLTRCVIIIRAFGMGISKDESMSETGRIRRECFIHSLAFLLAAFGIVTFSVGSALADVVTLSDLQASVAGTASMTRGIWYAQSFVAGDGAASFRLSEVDLLLGATAGTPTKSLDVSIFSNVGGAPGSVTAGGSLIAQDSIPEEGGVFAYRPSAATPVSLSASTTYWIVAYTQETEWAYTWLYSHSTTFSAVDHWQVNPTSGTYSQSYDSGGSWTAGAGDPQMFSLSVLAVPEPEPIALIFSVLTLAACTRRFRSGLN